MTASTFEGTIHVITSKALLFQCHYWEGPVWFPRSQTAIRPDGDEWVIIEVQDWLTKKRGILEFTSYNLHDIERIMNT